MLTHRSPLALLEWNEKHTGLEMLAPSLFSDTPNGLTLFFLCSFYPKLFNKFLNFYVVLNNFIIWKFWQLSKCNWNINIIFFLPTDTTLMPRKVKWFVGGPRAGKTFPTFHDSPTSIILSTISLHFSHSLEAWLKPHNPTEYFWGLYYLPLKLLVNHSLLIMCMNEYNFSISLNIKNLDQYTEEKVTI